MHHFVAAGAALSLCGHSATGHGDDVAGGDAVEQQRREELVGSKAYVALWCSLGSGPCRR